MWSGNTLARAVLATFVWTAGSGLSAAHAARLSYDAPHRCPSSTRFAEEVTARLGFSPWTDTGATLRVRITTEKAGFVGSLSPDASTTAAPPRRFVADSCRKVTDLLVTATAVALDRRDAAAQRGAAKPKATTATASVTKPKPRDRAHKRTTAEAPAATPAAAAPAGSDPALTQAAMAWSFAPRNNHVQAGLIFVSGAGFGVTGNVPVGRGHVQATYARLSSDSQFGESVNAQAHAYYLYPVFYINQGTAFEVPVFVGGGLGYQVYSYDQTMGTDHEETAIMPTVAVGTAIQFRAFPVEFLSQMTVSAVEKPLDGSHVGFNFAIRYVFGRD